MRPLVRSLTFPTFAAAVALAFAAMPAHAADKEKGEDPDKVCNEGPLEQREICKRELKKLEDAAKKVEKGVTNPSLPRAPTRPPVSNAPPPKRVDNPDEPPQKTRPPSKQIPTNPGHPPSRSPAPDPHHPNTGGGGGGGGGGGRSPKNSRGDCCAMAGLGAGGLIIGGLTGLLAGAAVGGGIGFFIPPDPKTDSQRGFDAGVGALIGGGAGAFLGGALGLGLGLAAGGVVSGEE